MCQQKHRHRNTDSKIGPEGVGKQAGNHRKTTKTPNNHRNSGTLPLPKRFRYQRPHRSGPPARPQGAADRSSLTTSNLPPPPAVRELGPPSARPPARPPDLFSRPHRPPDPAGSILPSFRIGDNNYNLNFVFSPISGRTWPRHPGQSSFSPP